MVTRKARRRTVVAAGMGTAAVAVAVVLVLGAAAAGIPSAFAAPRGRFVEQGVKTTPVAEPVEAPAATPEVPPPAHTPPTTHPTKPKVTGPCAKKGPALRAVEYYLAAHPQFGAVMPDGEPSVEDCKAIRKFQQRYGVSPAAGYAGPVTGRVVSRLNSAWSRMGQCRGGSGPKVCVDLTSQAIWVWRGGTLVLGPTTIRTGRAGLATPAGKYSVHEKKRLTRSTIFDVDLPYWQRFYADMGFHATPSYLYEGDSPGSHGCINLLRRDASALFGLTGRGTPVHIFGRKPGT